jgi:hypothetical protein
MAKMFQVQKHAKMTTACVIACYVRLFRPQRLHRVAARRPPGRKQAGSD